MASDRNERKANEKILNDCKHLEALCLVAQYKNIPLQLRSVKTDFDFYLSMPFMAHLKGYDGRGKTLTIPFSFLSKYMLNFPVSENWNLAQNRVLRIQNSLIVLATCNGGKVAVLREVEKIKNPSVLQEYHNIAKDYNINFKDEDCTNIKEWDKFYLSNFNMFQEMCNGNAPVWNMLRK